MPVPEAATVCHKCGKDPRSIRRWSGFLASGQGVLSLLVALFSVSGTIIALLSTLTFFHGSRTELLFRQFPPKTTNRADRGLTLEVTAYNSGNSPAFLSGARLVSRFAGKDSKFPLSFEEARIDHDDFKILRLTLEGGWDLRDLGIKSREEDLYRKLLAGPHSIEIGVQEFGKQLDWRKVKDVPLPGLRDWLRDVTVQTDSTAKATGEP